MFCKKLRWRETLEGILCSHRLSDELMIAGDQTVGLAQRSCYEDENVFTGNPTLMSFENLYQLRNRNDLYVEGLPDKVQQQPSPIFSANPAGYAPYLVTQFIGEKQRESSLIGQLTQYLAFDAFLLLTESQESHNEDVGVN